MKVQVELYANLSKYLPPGAEGRKAVVELPDGSTIGELLSKRLGHRPVVGDRIGLGNLELTVRAVAGNQVSSVGLKMSKSL